MALYQLTCTDCCSSEHRVGRKDAKYCPSCRLLRDLIHMTGQFKRPRTCRTCEAKFKPIRARDLRHCGTCSEHYQASSSTGPCRYCSHTRPLLHPSLPLCVRCAKDPEVQPRVIKALRAGRDRRCSENPPHPGPTTRLLVTT